MNLRPQALTAGSEATAEIAPRIAVVGFRGLYRAPLRGSAAGRPSVAVAGEPHRHPRRCI